MKQTYNVSYIMSDPQKSLEKEAITSLFARVCDRGPNRSSSYLTVTVPDPRVKLVMTKDRVFGRHGCMMMSQSACTNPWFWR
jgi:hypothetical protein